MSTTCGLLLIGLLLGNTQAMADANDGEYLGYRLGDKFPVAKNANVRNHILGALIVDLDPGQQPHLVDSMSIYVSPTSSIIGSILGEWYFSSERSAQQFADRYLKTLEEKYVDWSRDGRSLNYEDYQLWVDVEQKPLVTERWTSSKRYRVGVGLVYTPSSLGHNMWVAIVNMEANNIELTASQ
jgi:hypothetical protein